MKKTRFLTLSIIAVAILAACTSLPQNLPPSQPVPTSSPAVPPLPPTSEPTRPTSVINTPQPVGTLPPPEGDAMPRFLVAARQALAEKLGVPISQVTVVSNQQVDWPDACLGLPAKDEMCAQVITPGYRLTLRANNQDYEVRTGGANQSVRIGQQVPGVTSPVSVKAQLELANLLKVKPDAITILNIEEKMWPDSCLGISKPNIQCLQVITPGYQITLEVQGKIYIFHTNRTGTALLLASGSGAGSVVPADAVLSWKNSGTACRTAVISVAMISFGICDKPMLNLPWSDPSYRANYLHFISTFRSFSAETKAGSLQFTGYGAQQASPAEQRAIAEWVNFVISAIENRQENSQAGLALTWQREGGIAGFCDALALYRSGFARVSSCKGNQVGDSYLNSAQLEQLFTWLDQFKPLDILSNDPAKADAMKISLVLSGSGTQTAALPIQQKILLFAQDVYSAVTLFNANLGK